MATKIYSILSWCILWIACWGFGSCVFDGQWLTAKVMLRGMFFGLLFAWSNDFDFNNKDLIYGYYWLKKLKQRYRH